MSTVQSRLAKPPRAPDLAPQRERPPEASVFEGVNRCAARPPRSGAVRSPIRWLKCGLTKRLAARHR